MHALESKFQKPDESFKETQMDFFISNFEENEEFKILRGLKAQNAGRSKESIFELWYKTMGFQRRTQNLMNRFNEYWRDLN